MRSTKALKIFLYLGYMLPRNKHRISFNIQEINKLWSVYLVHGIGNAKFRGSGLVIHRDLDIVWQRKIFNPSKFFNSTWSQNVKVSNLYICKRIFFLKYRRSSGEKSPTMKILFFTSFGLTWEISLFRALLLLAIRLIVSTPSTTTSFFFA